MYYMYTYTNVHVREKQKEGRKKQARSNKQQGKATQHTQSSHFSKEKLAASGKTQTNATPVHIQYMF